MSARVLIIDDDPAVRDALRKVLETSGYCVEMGLDGQAGADLLQAQPFDLLLLDLDLPRISGWDILDLVRERRPALPVVVLTAFFDQCVPGALSGADAVMEKPPDVPRLLTLLAGLLVEPVEVRIQRHRKAPRTVPAPVPMHPSYRRQFR